MCVPGMIAAMTSARSANVPHRPSAQGLLEGLRTLGIVGTPTVVVCPLSSMCVNGCGRSSRITSRSNSFSSLTLFAHRHSCFVICVCVASALRASTNYVVQRRVRINLRRSKERAAVCASKDAPGPSAEGPVFDITDRAALLSYWAAMKLFCAQNLVSGWSRSVCKKEKAILSDICSIYWQVIVLIWLICSHNYVVFI